MKYIVSVFIALLACACTTENTSRRISKHYASALITERVMLESTSAYKDEDFEFETKLSVIPHTSQLRFSIKNTTEYDHYYLTMPYFYLLEYFDKGEWKQISDEVLSLEITKSIIPDEEADFFIDLGKYRDALKPGLYKVKQGIARNSQFDEGVHLRERAVLIPIRLYFTIV